MKKKRMAEGLLRGLKEAVSMEKGEIKGRVSIQKLSKPAPNCSKQSIKK